MTQHIAAINLYVHNQQQALDFFSQVLSFVVTDDETAPDGHRWLTVSTNSEHALKVIIAHAATEQQKAIVGKQAGDGVFAILQVDDFDASYAKLAKQGVRFCEAPREEPYGKVVIFEDIVGNKWDLIELN
ncbi:VOC family protein [Thalassotalea euphylliae]|uniref:VOC family protein n=1 Tax=Thalassotalea euphylliae TaxID=1655234 RepID=UPI00363A0E6F